MPKLMNLFIINGFITKGDITHCNISRIVQDGANIISKMCRTHDVKYYTIRLLLLQIQQKLLSHLEDGATFDLDLALLKS